MWLTDPLKHKSKVWCFWLVWGGGGKKRRRCSFWSGKWKECLCLREKKCLCECKHVHFFCACVKMCVEWTKGCECLHSLWARMCEWGYKEEYACMKVSVWRRKGRRKGGGGRNPQWNIYHTGYKWNIYHTGYKWNILKTNLARTTHSYSPPHTTASRSNSSFPRQHKHQPWTALFTSHEQLSPPAMNSCLYQPRRAVSTSHEELSPPATKSCFHQPRRRAVSTSRQEMTRKAF